MADKIPVFYDVTLFEEVEAGDKLTERLRTKNAEIAKKVEPLGVWTFAIRPVSPSPPPPPMEPEEQG